MRAQKAVECCIPEIKSHRGLRAPSCARSILLEFTVFKLLNYHSIRLVTIAMATTIPENGGALPNTITKTCFFVPPQLLIAMAKSDDNGTDVRKKAEEVLNNMENISADQPVSD